MGDSVELLHGWYSLHDFRHFDRQLYKHSSEDQKIEFRNRLLAFWEHNEALEARRGGSFGVYEVVGHKADLLFLSLRPQTDELCSLKNQMANWPLSQALKTSYSYFGVVELSNYVVGKAQRAEVEEMLDRRLRPRLPKTKHVCFYPMSKKREGRDNWYTLDMEERRRLMRSHGKLGRKYAEKIIQVISGSIGLDDYEWGVTLFAEDPLSFKEVVTDMRFDEVSARYASFGSFLIGNRLDRQEIIRWLEPEDGR